MIQLNFRCEEAFYWKLKEHKEKLEKQNKKRYSWETYLRLLFGIATGK